MKSFLNKITAWHISGLLIFVLLATDQSQLVDSLKFLLDALWGIIPFLLFAILFMAYASASSLDNIIATALKSKGKYSIVIAALIGGLSPFCSCGVIPLIAALLRMGFFVWMVVEYMADTGVEDLWVVPRWWLWMNAVLMFMAIGLTIMGNIPDKDARLGKGIFAITRHPTNWGIAIFAFAHMVSNPSVAAQIFWGSLLGAGVIGSYLLDKRKLKTGGERWVKSPENSSWLPFWALIKGRTTVAAEDFKLLPVSVAVMTFFVAMIIHVAFFGTYILPL